MGTTKRDSCQTVVLQLTPAIRSVRVRTFDKYAFTEIQFLDEQKKVLAEARAADIGEWREFQLGEGEVITSLSG